MQLGTLKDVIPDRISTEERDKVRSYSIVELAYVLGLDPDFYNQSLCYNGHDFRTRSLTFYEQTGTYYCYGCSESGSNIDLVMKVKNMAYPEAVKWLKSNEHRLDVSEDFIAFIDRKEKEIDKSPMHGTVAHEFHNRLTNDDVRYLQEVKGLSNYSINKFCLGKYEGRFTIPIIQNGDLINVKLYSPLLLPKIKYLRKNTGALLYGIDDMHREDYVIVCEGEWDCMILLQNNFSAVTPGAASTFRKEWIELFRDKDVYIIYDNDEAGKDGSVRVKEKLASVANYTKIVSMPNFCKEGEDVSDLFIKYKLSAQDFDKLLEGRYHEKG